jgi:hypothetical protein
VFFNKSWRYLLLLLTVAVPAAAQIAVMIPDTVASTGDTLCVPVIVGDMTGQNVTAFEFTVAFDTAVVNVVAPYYDASTGLAAGWTVLETHNNTNGSIHVGGFSTTALAGQGTLLCLRMRVLPGLLDGTLSPLSFNSFVFNEGTPVANTTGGSLTVQTSSLPAVSVSLPETSVIVNTQVCVPIILSEVAGRNITAFEFTVTFNSALVNVVSPYYNSSGSLAAGWTIMETHDNGTGEIHVGGFATEPLSGQGQLLCLEFQPLLTAPNGAVSPLTFTNFVFNEGAPIAQTTNGSLTTLCPVPAQVTGASASDGRCNDVLVTWNNVTGEDSFQIRRDGSRIGMTLADSISFADITAVVGTVYAYSVVAYNLCGPGPSSAPDSGRRITVPPQVSDVSTTDNRCTDVIITWGNVAGEDSFQIRRDGIRIGKTLADIMTITDTSAVPGVIYAYAVAAYNTCGQGLLSLPHNGQRRSSPPQVVNVLASDSAYCDHIGVTWNDVAGESGYRVKRNGFDLISSAANATSFNDSTALPWVSYNYSVVAFNECGDGQESTANSGTRKGVPTGTSIIASDHEFCDFVHVCWTLAAHATDYRFKRDGVVTDSFASDVTCFDDTTALPGSIYSYTIVPFNDCGSGPETPADLGSRRTVPAAITNFVASDNLCDGVVFTWSFTLIDVTGFRFYRDGNLIGTIPADSIHFRDTPPPGTYLYTMCAYNACENSPLATDQGTRLNVMPQVLGVNATDGFCNAVQITWNDVAGEDSFQIRRNGLRTGSVGANITAFTDIPSSGTYVYRVVAYNACGAGDSTGSDSGTRLPVLPPVPNVQATDGNCANIVITWSDIAGEDSFRVRRNGSLIGTVTANVTVFTDTPSSGTYVYRVVAYNTCGEGDSSGFDNGTRLSLPLSVIPTASDQGCDSIVVMWNGVTNADSFHVERNHASLAVLAGNVTRYADDPPAGSYLYTVYGSNICGNGTAASDSGRKYEVPGVPDSVQASDDRCGEIIVTWRAPSGHVDDLDVLRNGIVVGTVPVGTNSYTDSVTGQYEFKVRAHSTVCGDGPISAADSGWGHITAGIPSGLSATDTLCDQIVLEWLPAAGEFDRYLIYRDGVLRDSISATNYTDDPDNANEHVYQVAAKSAYCGEDFPSLPAAGREKLLITPLTDLSDTLVCRDTVTVRFTHCGDVIADSFSISLNGGAYTGLAGFSPAQTTYHVILPSMSQANTPNCRFMVRSFRGLRTDTLISPPFVIYCDLASDQLAEASIPKDFFLDQNYPNPFNPTTTIRFGLPKTADITIDIFDILGRKAATVMSGRMQPGVHSVVWACSACPSGMYLIKMQTGNRIFMHKMLLMK